MTVPALRIATRAVEDASDLLRRLPERDGLAWLHGAEGLVGIGAAASLDPGAGPDRFAIARDWLDDLARAADVDDQVGLPGTGVTAFGSFTFSSTSRGSVLVVPSILVGRRDGTTWVTTAVPEGTSPSAPATLPPDLGPPPPPQADRPRYAGSTLPDLHWLVRVADAVERLGSAATPLQKVVLARDHALWAKAPFQVRGVTARLAARFPDCFTFVVDGLVGATPELLVRRRGRDVWSEALAGTAARGVDDDSDEELGRALLASEKDAYEHRLAADSVDDVLRRRCDDLERTTPHLKRLDNVQHVATSFRGRLAGDDHVLDLVAALHPTAAVGGTPPELAVQTIAALEGMDRGRYAGPVGWLDANGDGEFGIALRCAELQGARARLFAGCGIVAASLPEDELEETRVKLLAMQRVLGDG